MSVLVIAPHADDEVLGCGGSIARATLAGIPVDVAVVTTGHPLLFSKRETDRIRREMVRAHEILGVRRSVRLDLPAPKLDTLPEHEVADRIAEIVRELRPATVMIPHMGDPHIDHSVVAR